MRANPLMLAALAAVVLPLSGCAIDVVEERQGDRTEVDISTPLGDMLVRTNLDTPNTGLPVYPGARPLRDDEPHNANVAIGSPLFGLKVAAARFESDAPPDAVLEYYKDEMRTYGEVVECRGNVNFRGRGRRPVCEEQRRSRETQLVVGTEERHHVVSIKPRGAGAEFAVVSIETRGRS